MMPAGDPRANQHLALLAVHTMLVGEYNRQPATFARNERLFQEARRQIIRWFGNVITAGYIRAYTDATRSQKSILGIMRTALSELVLKVACRERVVECARAVCHPISSPHVCSRGGPRGRSTHVARARTLLGCGVCLRPDLLLRWGLDSVLSGLVVSPAMNGQSGLVDGLRNGKTSRQQPPPPQQPQRAYDSTTVAAGVAVLALTL